MQCAGLVGPNENRVLLDHPVDSVICVVFRCSHQILLAVPLAAPHTREVGQERKKKPTNRQSDLDHPLIVLRATACARTAAARAALRSSASAASRAARGWI